VVAGKGVGVASMVAFDGVTRGGAALGRGLVVVGGRGGRGLVVVGGHVAHWGDELYLVTDHSVRLLPGGARAVAGGVASATGAAVGGLRVVAGGLGDAAARTAVAGAPVAGICRLKLLRRVSSKTVRSRRSFISRPLWTPKVNGPTSTLNEECLSCRCAC